MLQETSRAAREHSNVLSHHFPKGVQNIIVARIIVARGDDPGNSA